VNVLGQTERLGSVAKKKNKNGAKKVTILIWNGDSEFVFFFFKVAWCFLFFHATALFLVFFVCVCLGGWGRRAQVEYLYALKGLSRSYCLCRPISLLELFLIIRLLK